MKYWFILMGFRNFTWYQSRFVEITTSRFRFAKEKFISAKEKFRSAKEKFRFAKQKGLLHHKTSKAT